MNPQEGALNLMRQFVTILLIFVAFCAHAATDADLIAAGRAALDRGDPDEAIVQLEKAVTLEPNSSEAHYFLGTAYARKGEKSGMYGAMPLEGPQRRAE